MRLTDGDDVDDGDIDCVEDTLGDEEPLADGDCVPLREREGDPDCEVDAVALCVRETVTVIDNVAERLRDGMLDGVRDIVPHVEVD